MTLVSAIDLHSNNSVVAAIDEQDCALLPKGLPNDLSLILAALEPSRAGSGLALSAPVRKGQDPITRPDPITLYNPQFLFEISALVVAQGQIESL